MCFLGLHVLRFLEDLVRAGETSGVSDAVSPVVQEPNMVLIMDSSGWGVDVAPDSSLSSPERDFHLVSDATRDSTSSSPSLMERNDDHTRCRFARAEAAMEGSDSELMLL